MSGSIREREGQRIEKGSVLTLCSLNTAQEWEGRIWVDLTSRTGVKIPKGFCRESNLGPRRRHSNTTLLPQLITRLPHSSLVCTKAREKKMWRSSIVSQNLKIYFDIAKSANKFAKTFLHAREKRPQSCNDRLWGRRLEVKVNQATGERKAIKKKFWARSPESWYQTELMPGDLGRLGGPEIFRSPEPPRPRRQPPRPRSERSPTPRDVCNEASLRLWALDSISGSLWHS